MGDRLGVTAPPAQIPSVVSLSPASGTGNTVTYTAQYSHPAGATALTSVSLAGEYRGLHRYRLLCDLHQLPPVNYAL